MYKRNDDAPVRIQFVPDRDNEINLLDALQENAAHDAIRLFLERHGIPSIVSPSGLVGFVLTPDQREELSSAIRAASNAESVHFVPLGGYHPPVARPIYSGYL